MDPVRHLYLHVPFCPHICPYCSFHVLPANKQQAYQVVDLLLSEYQSIADDLEPETIFLGGGTPTALSTELLERLLAKIVPRDLKNRIEVTSECNPSTLSLQKAERILTLGVNRLSIGAQSLDATVLTVLGRTHSVRAIQECVATARRSGFQNINLDLIFGVPGQTLESWTATLRAALDLQPQHLSCYGLTYEEDTEFFVRRQQGSLQSDPDLEKAMFETADRLLTAAGFHHYEISNYALPGFESLHNLAYWRGEDYYGIGPSAVSTVRGMRRLNSKFDGQGWRIAEEEILTPKLLASERMALGLRTSEGVNPAEFTSRYGFDPQERWKQEIQTLVQTGLMQTHPRLHLTPRGREVADEVATYFM